MSSFKVLLVDDHALFREGVALLLRRLEPDAQIVEAGSLAEAQARLKSGGEFDLVLLDLGLPDAEGLSAIGALQAMEPGVPLVVLSANDDRAAVLQAIEEGAMGYVTKHSASAVMLEALKTVLQGGVALPPSAFLRESPGGCSGPADGAGDLGLTDRQLEVLRLILQGMAAKQIASALDISPSTVKAHTAAVLRALNVTTRTQVVVEASRRGIQIGAVARR
jgi:DNA-binding NarL/FixJ family response regulator